MSEIKSVKDAADLFQRINRLCSEDEWTEGELRELFLEEGINPSLLVESVRAEVSRLIRESPYHWRNKASALRSKLAATALAVQRRQKESLPRKELLGNIEATLARMPPALAQQFSFEHRNFADCSYEDLASILTELECIEKLDRSHAGE